MTTLRRRGPSPTSTMTTTGRFRTTAKQPSERDVADLVGVGLPAASLFSLLRNGKILRTHRVGL